MLQPKEEVLIFDDPFTCKKPEGVAVVVRHLEHIDFGVESYLVHFMGDPKGENVIRKVVDECCAKQEPA